MARKYPTPRKPKPKKQDKKMPVKPRAKRRKTTKAKAKKTTRRRKSGGLLSGKYGKAIAVGGGLLAVLAVSAAAKQFIKPTPDEKIKSALTVAGSGAALYLLAKVAKTGASVKTAAVLGTGAVLALELLGPKVAKFGAEQGAKLTKDKRVIGADPYLTGQIGYDQATSYVQPNPAAAPPPLGAPISYVQPAPVAVAPPAPPIAAPIYLPEKSSEEIWAGVLGNLVTAGGQVAGSYMGMAGAQAGAQMAAMQLQRSQMFGGAMGWGYDSALGSQGWGYDSAI